MNNDRFEILSYEKSDKGSLVGKFSVHVKRWGITIDGMCHFKKDNKEWVGFPSQWKEDSGQGKYFPTIEFCDKKHEAEFKRLLLEVLKER